MLDVLEAKETPPKHRAKKNTKHWCKGRPGRVHLPVWESKYWQYIPRKTGDPIIYGKHRELTCMVCGKILDMQWRQFEAGDGSPGKHKLSVPLAQRKEI
jgi:hypothetical protein